MSGRGECQRCVVYKPTIEIESGKLSLSLCHFCCGVVRAELKQQYKNSLAQMAIDKAKRAERRP